MVERATREALRKVGSRQDALNTCPACGREVTRKQEMVRVWSGTYAHEACTAYAHDKDGRKRHSHRIHRSFTRL